MHRYDELEQLYYKNKIKKYVKIFISAVFIFIAVLYLLPENEKKQKTEEIKVDFKKIAKTASDDRKQENKKKVSEKKETKKKTDKTNKKEKNELKISFNYPKIGEINISKHKRHTTLKDLSFEIPEIKNTPEPKKMRRETEKTASKPPVKKQNTVNVSDIKVISSIKEETINVKELISSFNKQPSYDMAMIISQYFFNKKDYKNAKLWALKANNIDPSKYESWKMFALILLKNNNKEKAAEVLRIYLNDYGDNDEIYKLLRSIDE